MHKYAICIAHRCHLVRYASVRGRAQSDYLGKPWCQPFRAAYARRVSTTPASSKSVRQIFFIALRLRSCQAVPVVQRLLVIRCAVKSPDRQALHDAPGPDKNHLSVLKISATAFHCPFCFFHTTTYLPGVVVGVPSLPFVFNSNVPVS